jgi:hypothetical protein
MSMLAATDIRPPAMPRQVGIELRQDIFGEPAGTTHGETVSAATDRPGVAR